MKIVVEGGIAPPCLSIELIALRHGAFYDANRPIL
jgi:hypothetical protein